MPSPTYQQNKKHIYNWRVKNPEKTLDGNRERSRKCMMFLKERRRFLAILIDL